MDYRSEHNNDGACGRYLSVDDNIEHYSIRTNQHTQIQWGGVRLVLKCTRVRTRVRTRVQSNDQCSDSGERV